MYNQHTRGMETTRHRSLVEGGGRKALFETLHTHTKKNVRKNRYSRIKKKRFEHIELPAKLLAYFLRSNKSNINQSSKSRKIKTEGVWFGILLKIINSFVKCYFGFERSTFYRLSLRAPDYNKEICQKSQSFSSRNESSTFHFTSKILQNDENLHIHFPDSIVLSMCLGQLLMIFL